MEVAIAYSELVAEIQNFIFENTFVDTKKITPETLIFQEGYFDSMGFVSLISFLEDRYSIEVSSEDLVEENFESINAITKYVISKK